VQETSLKQSTPPPSPSRLRVGDKAAYYVVKHSRSKSRADIYIHRGVIFKIEKERVTLKHPTGRTTSVWLPSLAHRGPTHEMSRAISRSSNRLRRKLLSRTTS
jgi:hypothetical protein